MFETGLAGYIFNMNRPAGQTTEVTRALWFRISPRPMFVVCRQVFQCFTLVGVCMCMSAWINERMTEWLFFYRLKTKRHGGDSNWQKWDLQSHVLAHRLRRPVGLRIGLELYVWGVEVVQAWSDEYEGRKLSPVWSRENWFRFPWYGTCFLSLEDQSLLGYIEIQVKF